MQIAILVSDGSKGLVPGFGDRDRWINLLAVDADRQVAVIFEINGEDLRKLLQRVLGCQGSEIAFEFADDDGDAERSAFGRFLISDTDLADLAFDDCYVVSKWVA